MSRRTSTSVRVLLAVAAAVLIVSIFVITVHPYYDLSDSALRSKYAVALFFWSMSAGALMMAGRILSPVAVTVARSERVRSVIEMDCLRRI